MRLTKQEKEALRRFIRAFGAAVDDPKDRGVLVLLQLRIEDERCAKQRK